MSVIRSVRNKIRKHLDAFLRMVWHISIKFEMMREREPDKYVCLIRAMHRRLQIRHDYTQRGLPFCRQPLELVAVPCGLNGKQLLMTPDTRDCFLAMQAAAAGDGVNLFVLWSYRSADDQAQLIRQQLSYGKTIDGLLTWIAAPGYSEHHTGRALDFETMPADMEFEDTREFDWLCKNAGKFQFRLSYPRNNIYGIIYEPWHWCCHGE